MFKLENVIFKFFGLRAKQLDSNKDEQGRGTEERMQRVLAAEYDEHIAVKVRDNLQQLISVDTCMLRFVEYWQQLWGNSFNAVESSVFKRKMLSMIVSIYRIRGTERCYHAMFNLCGFTDSRLEVYDKWHGLDSELKLDDNDRRLDSTLQQRIPYGLHLSGTMEDNGETRQLIRDIVRFCEPVYAQLQHIFYNAQEIILDAIVLYINEDGDLVFDNENDPALQVELNADGDLIMLGTNEHLYGINDDGDLTYQD